MTTIPDDMVERVARAICERSGQPWSHSGDGYREICSDFASAAIEAMQPAILAAEKRGEERERERCAGIAHKQVFTAKQWGGKDEMLEGGNRRARVIAYLIRKGSD